KAKRIDGRSDLFAVGVMFYEFVSYRRPFPGDSITAVIYKIVNENPPPLHELQGTPYEWLEGVIFQCLEKDANKRWATCEELAQALRKRSQVAVQLGESGIDQTLQAIRERADRGDVDGALAQLEEILDQDPESAGALRVKRALLSSRVVREAQALAGSGRLE